jgi:hypothetical protein
MKTIVAAGNDEKSTETETAVTTFTPNSKLQNLILIDKLDNLSPTIDVLVGELTDGLETAPQIYTIGGKGPSACLKTLRHGCSVTELALSELPGIPGQIFTVNNISEEGNSGDGEGEGESNNNYSKYIVVSFADATLVLSVGDTVEEVGRESGTLRYVAFVIYQYRAFALLCVFYRFCSLCVPYDASANIITITFILQVVS